MSRDTDAADQPAATRGYQQRAGCGQVLEDFECDGAAAGYDGRIVVCRDEGHVALAGEAQTGRLGIVVRLTTQPQLGP